MAKFGLAIQTMFAELTQRCLDAEFDETYEERGWFVKRRRQARMYWYYKQREGDTFRGWLRTITRSKLSDAFRRRGRTLAAPGGSAMQRRVEEVQALCDDDDAAEQTAEQELFFRGFIFTGLARLWGLVPGVIVSGLLFSSAHVSYKSFIPIALVGMVFAYTYSRSRNIVSTMVAHCAFNSFSIASSNAPRR